ncbi:hypothetical protein J3R30DRAFT_758534 [Lentinula aciculospora]|uniref:Uncharacterized protein n=1 Tax=Lentinula aciculospora TaxID=153920 RepID=A0A9W9A3H5_9AGAR|nr:hypothetical protein J3R30DRAFT_758534 [Lentinula aciculospora]
MIYQRSVLMALVAIATTSSTFALPAAGLHSDVATTIARRNEGSGSTNEVAPAPGQDHLDGNGEDQPVETGTTVKNVHYLGNVDPYEEASELGIPLKESKLDEGPRPNRLPPPHSKAYQKLSELKSKIRPSFGPKTESMLNGVFSKMPHGNFGSTVHDIPASSGNDVLAVGSGPAKAPLPRRNLRLTYAEDLD